MAVFSGMLAGYLNTGLAGWKGKSKVKVGTGGMAEPSTSMGLAGRRGR